MCPLRASISLQSFAPPTALWMASLLGASPSTSEKGAQSVLPSSSEISLGIEQEVVSKYGRDYWDENKKSILARANKNGQLQREKVFPNSRERRALRRAEEQLEEEEAQEESRRFDVDTDRRGVRHRRERITGRFAKLLKV